MHPILCVTRPFLKESFCEMLNSPPKTLKVEGDGGDSR